MKCLLTIVFVCFAVAESHRRAPHALKCAEDAGLSQETVDQLKVVFARPAGRPIERPTPEQRNAMRLELQAKVKALITDETQFEAFEKCMKENRPRKDRGSRPPEVSAEATTAGNR